MALPPPGFSRQLFGPKQLHGQLLKRGMDYVTITDHDTIEGCLQIAHLPRTFISEQVTTYFPNDPCKLHILVWGISEHQHREIEGVRDNIFELQRYLQTTQIAHAVAHPLYSVNGKLEAKHLEQLTLLFKHFEAINGLRDALLSDLAQTLFRQLTPAKIDEFCESSQPCADTCGAVEKDFRRRLGRSRRTICRFGFYRNAGCAIPQRNFWNFFATEIAPREAREEHR